MIKDIIKDLRKSKKISQEKLAQELNIPRYTLSNWEQGRTEPNCDQLRLICVYFDISSDELLEIETKAERKKVMINNSFNNSKNINLKL